jgi:hypothetical protein
MNKKKIIIWSLLGILVLMQLYPVTRPEVNLDNPDDLITNVDMPEKISSILESACYDCHSNETKYPWYTNIAPVKWLIYDHVIDARDELNFSEWKRLTKKDMVEKLDDISSEVIEGEMPLKFYPLMHPNAKLTKADRKVVSEWAERLSEELFD